jgi:hypothetical protein
VRGAGRVGIGPLTLLPFWEGGEVVVVVAEVEAKREEEAGRNNAVGAYREAESWKRDAVRRPRKVIVVISLGAVERRSTWEKRMG